VTSISHRVAVRYKKKMVSDKGNTIYQYSERQVALRNSKKAERLEKLRKSVHKLRAQVKKDLNSGDPERVLTALAVGLMDHTAERVGNSESADERGHFGVTGWQKGHVSFGKGKATVSYTGKSGVKQKKSVTDKALVSALRDAHAACEGDDIFCQDTVTVDAPRVNAYLKKFDITAKDLRGLHANTLMQQELKAVRSNGGELPSDTKAREKQLKAEFKKALEAAAEAVGHEASTLRSQYLVPGLEEEFMKGRVMDKMVKTALVRTIDEAWVEKLRKDFLVLLKNLPKVKDYETGVEFRLVVRKYADTFKRWVFDEFLNPLKENEDASFEGVRKPAWDFYGELISMPLNMASSAIPAETSFYRYEEKRKAWEQRLRAKSQALWRTFKNYIGYREQKKIDVEVADRDRLVLEGFQAEVTGWDGESWQAKAFEQFKEALRVYRRNATKVMPWLIQKQLPLELNFDAKLGEGGRYHHGVKISISMMSMSGETVQWGVHMLAHEMGHHLFKHLDQEAEIFWSTAIRGDYGPIDLKEVLDGWPESTRFTHSYFETLINRDPVLALQIDVLSRENEGNMGWEERSDFQRAFDGGTRTVTVPKTPITGYAGKNPEEAFCEAIALLVAYGPRAVHVKIRHWLEIVVPGKIKIAARVAQRFLAAS
jgi:DNA topoisomerase-1